MESPERRAEKAEYAAQNAAIPLYGYQQRWVCDPSRFKIGLWSRQTGKSFSTALEAVLDCDESRCDWVFLSAGERQSKELIRKAKMHSMALEVGYEGIGESDVKVGDTVFKQLEIEYKNGSRILALPANPDTARGHSAHVVLDEFAFHQDSRKIWAALFPTITRGFKIRIISTPQGKKNKFYELWSGNPRYSKHQVDIYKAIEEGLPIFGDDGELVGPEYLQEALDDEEAWRQEYLCEFVDEATAWIPYELITAAEDIRLGILNEAIGGQVFVGIDVGRKKDKTVYWAVEKVLDTFWTKKIVELTNEPFHVQFNRFLTEIDDDKPRRVCIDSTGIGSQLAEDLKGCLGSIVEPVDFRNAVKEDLAVTTKRIFEDRRVRIPADRKIREDIHSVKKVVTAAGNSRFDAERTKDGHADRFWALALALSAGQSAKGVLEVLSGMRRKAALLLEGF